MDFFRFSSGPLGPVIFELWAWFYKISQLGTIEYHCTKYELYGYWNKEHHSSLENFFIQIFSYFQTLQCF